MWNLTRLTYRYKRSFQVTTEWLVRAGGIWPCGGPPSIVFWISISQRLLACWRAFKSKATKSLKKKPSTCPPKMYILDPRMFKECPYRPGGRCPAGAALDHCLVARICQHTIDQSRSHFHQHVFSRYSVSSSISLSSVLVSPPKTIKAFPTNKLAWPTLGPGPSEVVATG